VDPCLAISPHLDDVVLSLGQFLAGRPDVIVATVCTDVPARAHATGFDRNCGFRFANEAVRARRREDILALEMLHAAHRHLGFYDSQYGTELDAAEITLAILGLVDKTGCDLVLGPLGLVHPDHQVVAQAMLDAATKRPDLQWWLYEELPARVLWPERVAEALDRVRAAGFDPVLDFIGTGDLERKHRALLRYSSQRWALPDECLYVPERTWRL
jgi:LmbE family N-acetylglucosaminyl deacetylase